MKIVVIEGRGLIGTKLVKRLPEASHEVIAASPNSGVNTITAGVALSGLLAPIKQAPVSARGTRNE
jgi:predicted dinucleotide-binding enzyme